MAETLEQKIRRDYGYLAAFMDNGEVRFALERAALEGWDEATLRGAIQNTQWWKNHSQAEREWVALQSDPAEVGRRVEARRAELREQATRLGITVSDDRLKQIATDSLKFAWDATQLQNALGAEFDFVPGATGQTGMAVVSLDSLRTEANRWAVPMDDSMIEPWIEGIVRGQRTLDEYQVFVKEAAKSARPWLSPAIDAGQSIEEISGLYKQDAAKELGLDPSQINLMDAKWSRFLDYVDPQSGNKRLMDRWEWTKTLRTDQTYGWRQGPEGQRVQSEVDLNFAKMFGATA